MLKYFVALFVLDYIFFSFLLWDIVFMFNMGAYSWFARLCWGLSILVCGGMSMSIRDAEKRGEF